MKVKSLLLIAAASLGMSAFAYEATDPLTFVVAENALGNTITEDNLANAKAFTLVLKGEGTNYVAPALLQNNQTALTSWQVAFVLPEGAEPTVRNTVTLDGVEYKNIAYTARAISTYDEDEESWKAPYECLAKWDEETRKVIAITTSLNTTPLKATDGLIQLFVTRITADVTKVDGKEINVKGTDVVWANGEVLTNGVDQTIKIKKAGADGINDIAADKAVAGVKYYNVAGVESAEPFDGVNIVVTKYVDGTTSAVKVIK